MASLILCIAAAQIFFSLNSYFPTWYWFQEISINLGVYWLGAHVLTLVLVMLWRNSLGAKKTIALVAAMLLLSTRYAGQTARFVLGRPAQLKTVVAERRNFKVLLVTLPASGSNREEVSRLISEEKPDVLGVLGLTESWVKDLDLKKNYRHSKEIPKHDEFGIGLYSQFPFDGVMETDAGENLPPIVKTEVLLAAGEPLGIILFHGIPPLQQSEYYQAKVFMRRVSTPLRQTTGRTLVFGNFNASEFSGSYRRFIDAGKLIDAMRGFGYFRTWNSANALERLKLDHILVRRLAAVNFKRLESVGAAHYPIMAELSWAPTAR